MQIKYSNKKEDIKNFNMHVAKTVPAIKRNIIINTLFVPALILVTGGFLKLSPTIIFAAAVIFTALYIVLVMSTLKKQLARLYKNNDFVERTVEITSKGIKEIKEDSQREISWEEIKSVEEDKRYIYIFTSIQYALIIPKSAFASNGDARGFFTNAKDYLDKEKKNV